MALSKQAALSLPSRVGQSAAFFMLTLRRGKIGAMSGVNYYELFSLSPDASLVDLRQRYRTLSLTHHPDRGGSTEQMAELNQAYRVLSNPQLRHDYDLKLLARSDEFTGGYRMTHYTAPSARAVAADERILPNPWMRFAFVMVVGLVVLAYSVMNNIILPSYLHEARSTAPPSAIQVTEPRETNLSDEAAKAVDSLPTR